MTENEMRNIIVKRFDYTWNFKFLDLIELIIDSIDDFENDDSILDGIDRGLIYHEDQWTIARFYSFSPINMKWDEVMEQLIKDVFAICSELAK